MVLATLEDIRGLSIQNLSELWVRYQGVVRTFHCLEKAGEWLLLKFELAEAAVQYSRMISSVCEEAEVHEPDLPRERKKIAKQVKRLRQAKDVRDCEREVSEIEAAVRQHLESETDIRKLFALQEKIDAVVKRFPNLYKGKKINGEINRVVNRIWVEAGGHPKAKVRPHIRCGHPYARAHNGFREGSLIHEELLREVMARPVRVAA